MAPLPTTGTLRALVPFIWRDRTSLTLFRFADGVSPAEAVAALEDFLSTIDDVMRANSGWGDYVRVYPAGSTVSSDISITPNSGGAGGSDLPTDPDALFWEFTGRSADGRRVAWYLKGLNIAKNEVQRVQQADNAAVATVVAAFGTLIVAGLCTISGESPVLKGYANEVVNDYLTRQARRG
jgi:hypothetical protein